MRGIALARYNYGWQLLYYLVEWLRIETTKRYKNMSKVDELKAELEVSESKYRQVAERASDAWKQVEETREYKRYSEWKEQRSLVAREKKEIEAQLKKAEYEEGVSRLKTMGFEARTGHQTGSSNHRDWQSDSGEPWTWVICHKSCPKLVGMTEWSSDASYDWEDEGDHDVKLIGHGESEEEAWEDAIGSDEEDMANALGAIGGRGE